MAFIYDNLVATVVSLTVVLILASIQMDATSMRASNNSRDVAITQAETFGAWMEEELSRVGRNLDENPITAFDTEEDERAPTGSVTKEFAFRYAAFDDGGNRTEQEVTYRLCDTGEDQEVHTRDGIVSRDLLQLRRRESGSEKDPEDLCDAPSSSDGDSPPALGYFHVQRLRASLKPAPTQEQTELLRVKYSVIAPFQGEDTVLQEVHRSVVVPFTLGEM